MTDSPNGRQTRNVVTRATTPVVMIRIGWSVRRSQARRRASGPFPSPVAGPSSPAASAPAASGSASAAPASRTGQKARRIVTTARIGMRMPSCGLMSAAMTA